MKDKTKKLLIKIMAIVLALMTMLGIILSTFATTPI